MTRPRRGRVTGAAALAALVAVAAATSLMARRDGGDEDRRQEAAGREAGEGSAPADVSRFFEVMRLAFTGVTADGATFEARAAEVAAGARPAPDLLADLDASLQRAAGTRDLVGASVDLSGRAAARQLYLRSALLYAEALWALRAAAEAGDDAGLRLQLVLQARRLKVLSDRVYDRGTAAADPDVERAEAVPDWGAAGLAAGPPLVPPAEGWGGRLGSFVAAADTARLPAGRQAEVTGLAVLIDAEAAAAWATVPAGEARARRLSLLGEDVWAAAGLDGGAVGLPPHPVSGFERAELEPQPVPGLTGGLGNR